MHFDPAPHESFHVIAKRIRRRTLWLQDAARQIELNGGAAAATSARKSVVNHIIEITKADLARIRILWKYSSPEDQAHRGAEYTELHNMLGIGLKCVTRQKTSTASSSSLSTEFAAPNKGPPSALTEGDVVIDMEQNEEEEKVLRDIYADLVGLQELTNELAKNADSARNDLFSMEESAKQALLNTDRSKNELFKLQALKARRRKFWCALAASLLTLLVCSAIWLKMCSP